MLQDYSEHIFLNLLDRQVDSHWADMSVQCSELLRSGQIMNTIARRMSLMLVRIDGMDQAKFRVPRALKKSHITDALLRPALHIQGVWSHGFAFHLAIADADIK